MLMSHKILAGAAFLASLVACATPPPAALVRDCEPFITAVESDAGLPDWVRNWTPDRTRPRREFVREEMGLTYCRNASVFGRDEALVILAQDLRLVPRLNSIRLSELTDEQRSLTKHFAVLAEQNICPEWRTTRYALGSWDKDRPQLSCLGSRQ
jgi:hypothetical protein